MFGGVASLAARVDQESSPSLSPDTEEGQLASLTAIPLAEYEATTSHRQTGMRSGLSPFQHSLWATSLEAVASKARPESADILEATSVGRW